MSSSQPFPGFSPRTNTFRSLHEPLPLPPPTVPISFPSYALSLLPSPLPACPAFVDPTRCTSLSYPDFVSQVRALSFSLQTYLSLSKGDVVVVLSPPRLDLPLLYFALLSIGVVVAYIDPSSTLIQVSRMWKLVNPTIVFSTSASVRVANFLKTITTVLLDPPLFATLMIHGCDDKAEVVAFTVDHVDQTDPAVIIFSLGSGPRLDKAAVVSHRRLIAVSATTNMRRLSCQHAEVRMLVGPLLDVVDLVKGVAVGGTTLVMKPRGVGEVLQVMEKHRVSVIEVSASVVAAIGRSEEVSMYDLSKLEQVVVFGRTSMVVEDTQRFRVKFPKVELCQGYGSIEAGEISMMNNHEEPRSVGRLSQSVVAKIVDVVSSQSLSIGEQGELWIWSPSVMIGYINDEEANASTFDSDGWLKTGDVCYFDDNGCLFVMGRVKEMITYQVSSSKLECLLQSTSSLLSKL